MHKLILKSGREKSVWNRHPWIFSGAVQQMPPAENGEIVEVCTSKFDLLGYAFFSSHSQITARIFEFTTESIPIDSAYWLHKIRQAYTLRMHYLDMKLTTCYRLLHAEGDFFPGIIADVYGEVVVIQLLIRGTERIQDDIQHALRTLGFTYIYLKTKQSSQRLEQVVSSGWLTHAHPMPISVTENGMRFQVDVETGQKTGFFLDQRDNRALLSVYSKGKKVLNTFSYSGGFSVYALHAGAALVHSVDSSKEAIAQCDINVALNGYTASHQSFVSDVFDFLKLSEESYDIMVLDPPAFAKSAKAVSNATRGYKNLNLTAFKKIKSGGLVFTFSCSQHIDRDLFRKIVFGAAADAKREIRILHQFTQPFDHPVSIYHPEGEYLKGLLLHVS